MLTMPRMRSGSAISRRSVTSTAGPMAPISRHVSKTKSSASCADRRDAGRPQGWSASPKAPARARRTGAICCSTLKRRGLDEPPQLTIADGALGFWKAADEVWPKTREQRCWVHKTANVLARLPKSQPPKAKRALQEIWMTETKAGAELAFDASSRAPSPHEKARRRPSTSPAPR